MNIKEFKNKISLKEFEVVNTSSSNVAGNFFGSQKGFNVKEAAESLKVCVVKMDRLDMEFDMVGYDPAISNALRRILLSDIPSMAIEKVHMYQNTMQDEVLAHRLGLLPLRADPRLFSYPLADWSPESGTAQDTLDFSLTIKCTSSSDPTKQYNNDHVLTRHMEWVPRGDQEKWMGTTDPGCADKDILINKLRPGHEIKMFAVKVSF
jgi:DNA-directed RNA polymerase I and III subunit RPAC1